MTRPEWMAICSQLNELFAQPIEPSKAEAYFPLLADQPADAVLAAVHRLVKRDRLRWLPTAAEILDAVDAGNGAAGPAVLQAAPFSTVLGVVDGARFLEPSAAVERMRLEAGDVAAAWMCAEGIGSLRAMELGHPEFGATVKRDLERRYKAFVADQAQRHRLGLPMAEATPQGRLAGGNPAGPRRPDFAAAIGAAPVGELGAGS